MTVFFFFISFLHLIQTKCPFTVFIIIISTHLTTTLGLRNHLSSFVELVPDRASPGQQHSGCLIIHRRCFNWMSQVCSFLEGGESGRLFYYSAASTRLCLVSPFGPPDCGRCKLRILSSPRAQTLHLNSLEKNNFELLPRCALNMLLSKELCSWSCSGDSSVVLYSCLFFVCLH